MIGHMIWHKRISSQVTWAWAGDRPCDRGTQSPGAGRHAKSDGDGHAAEGHAHAKRGEIATPHTLLPTKDHTQHGSTHSHRADEHEHGRRSDSGAEGRRHLSPVARAEGGSLAQKKKHSMQNEENVSGAEGRRHLSPVAHAEGGTLTSKRRPRRGRQA